MTGKSLTGRSAMELETANEFAFAYEAQDDAQDYVKAARNPEDSARAYEFPDLEDAMPRARRSLVSAWALISPWGWGVIATALFVGLIMFVTLGGTV